MSKYVVYTPPMNYQSTKQVEAPQFTEHPLDWLAFQADKLGDASPFADAPSDPQQKAAQQNMYYQKNYGR
jgi:hypothetical protein